MLNWRVVVFFPLLCFRKRKHSNPSLTLLSQHERMLALNRTRVTSCNYVPDISTQECSSEIILNFMLERDVVSPGCKNGWWTWTSSHSMSFHLCLLFCESLFTTFHISLSLSNLIHISVLSLVCSVRWSSLIWSNMVEKSENDPKLFSMD